jgi:hypothetical protein
MVDVDQLDGWMRKAGQRFDRTLSHAISRVLTEVEQHGGDVGVAARELASVLRLAADQLEGMYPRT